MRSEAPDPAPATGHAHLPAPVWRVGGHHAAAGGTLGRAPQSIYSDHFLHTQPIDGPIGYKLEVAPLHPVFFGATCRVLVKSRPTLFKQYPNANGMVAIMRDGFHDQSVGGKVEIRADGSPVLDYPLTDYVLDGARRSLLAMARIQFEAGAKMVYPGHEMAAGTSTWEATEAAIEALPMKPLLTRIGSAHVMGGCGLSGTEKLGVTRPDGQHWQIDNLSIHDGSIFPTSIGANPQLSIYGSVNRLAQGLAETALGAGRDLGIGSALRSHRRYRLRRGPLRPFGCPAHGLRGRRTSPLCGH